MCLPLLFLPAAQCFTLYILHFLLVLSPSDGYPIASHFSQTMLWWKSLYSPSRSSWEFLWDKFRSRIACHMNAYCLSESIRNLLSIMARAVYTPTSNAGGFLYYTPHSMSANPWIYPYIWTHIFISFRL